MACIRFQKVPFKLKILFGFSSQPILHLRKDYNMYLLYINYCNFETKNEF